MYCFTCTFRQIGVTSLISDYVWKIIEDVVPNFSNLQYAHILNVEEDIELSLM